MQMFLTFFLAKNGSIFANMFEILMLCQLTTSLVLNNWAQIKKQNRYCTYAKHVLQSTQS